MLLNYLAQALKKYHFTITDKTVNTIKLECAYQTATIDINTSILVVELREFGKIVKIKEFDKMSISAETIVDYITK